MKNWFLGFIEVKLGRSKTKEVPFHNLTKQPAEVILKLIKIKFLTSTKPQLISSLSKSLPPIPPFEIKK
jgi:hypothetical protein